MNAKKVLSLLLALLMVLSLAACGEKPADDQTEEPTIKERLIIADASTLGSSYPMDNNSVYNRRVYRMTHSRLVDYNINTGEVIPDFAKSWDVSPDGLVYTFYLQEGVKFHNGHDCTAEDVIYSFDRAADSSTMAPVVSSISKIEAVNDYTIKMTLSVNNVEFLIALSNGSMVIMDKEALDADPDKGGMVGTGPYVFTEWVPEDYVLLTRNEEYWGELPKSKEIEYKRIPEASARVIALRTGEVDVCLEVPAIEATHVADTEGLELIQLPTSKLVYAALNVSEGGNPAVRDVRVRQAFNYATNPEEIISALTEGYGKPANGVIPQAIWGYSDAVKGYTYDVEKAKQLLAEAGYNESNPLEITFSHNGTTFPGMFELLQAQWAKAGIKLTLSTDVSAVYTEQLRTKVYDIYQTQVLLTSIGDLNVIWHSTSNSNRTVTKDPTLDAMLDEALTITDKDERLAKYAAVSQYLTDSGAMIPLYIDTLLSGVSEKVEGLQLFGNGGHAFTYAYAVE